MKSLYPPFPAMHHPVHFHPQRVLDFGMPRPAEKTDADRHKSPSSDPVECVMICAGARAPDELVRTLESRGATLAIVSDVFAAAALVAESQTGQAVVIVEPDRVPRADELAKALRTRAPDVVCWRFCAAERPQLCGYFSSPRSRNQSNADPDNLRTDASSAAPNRNGEKPNKHEQAESLRFRDGMLDVEFPGEDESLGSPLQHTDDAPPARASLTSEELAMLLRDDLDAPDQEGV